jgi:hypothetical protein
VTTSDKLNPSYKCCKGVAKDGTYTVFPYCVDISNASFTVPGKEGSYNFDCRDGAYLLKIGTMISLLVLALSSL